MDPRALQTWFDRAQGQPLRRALGEELRLDTPLPVRRVTRLWLEFADVPPIGLSLDPASGGLRWDDSEPHAFVLAEGLETRILDITRRAAIETCVDRHLSNVQPIRFVHGEKPCGLELEFDGFLGLLIFAWGDAVEAWDRDDVEELEAQGFHLERIEG
ncbi:MAG: hypothetical protein AAFZ65_07430 [Planctomycetota bacterium]